MAPKQQQKNREKEIGAKPYDAYINVKFNLVT